MGMFVYKAQSAQGAVIEGRLEVATRQEALRQLAQQGLKPLRLEGGNGGVAPSGAVAAAADKPVAGRLNLKLGSKKVSHQSLNNFTRQLASLLTSGVPLARGLQILGREKSSPAAAQCWRQIHDLVVDGNSLADAMSQRRDVFPRVYIAMVRAGELGGFLDVVLSQIADFQERERDLKGKVTSAMVYPAVLMLMAIGVLIFLLTFFIPRFQTIFEGFGAALPLLTRFIIWSSEVMIQYGPLLLLAVVLAGYAVRQWLSSDAGRRQWQQIMLRLPVIGPLTAKFAMTRFCRMLGTQIASGVPLIMGLRVARESIGNQMMVDAVSDSIERVQKGESLSSSLAACPVLFSGTAIEMISVAEESGNLDTELVRIASVSEKDLDSQLRMAVSLAEPLLLFLMAAFIGTIFIGMVIPIFTIQDFIK